MKEIIGDDYPTYEDSVKQTLAEKAKTSDLTLDSACTYLNEVEQRIHKENMERLLKKKILNLDIVWLALLMTLSLLIDIFKIIAIKI